MKHVNSPLDNMLRLPFDKVRKFSKPILVTDFTYFFIQEINSIESSTGSERKNSIKKNLFNDNSLFNYGFTKPDKVKKSYDSA